MTMRQPVEAETVGGEAVGDEEDPQRYRRTLAGGILVFRWVWLVWMVALAISASGDFRLPGLAWASIGGAAAWTAWLTATRHRWTTPALWFDLVLCGWLVLASGLVVEDGGVISGRPFFATGYPLSAPLFWGASRGVRNGLFAGAVLGAAHIASRPLNGVGIAELSATQFQNMLGAVLNYIVAGVAIGIVSRVLVRSAEAVAAASQRLIRERERAARLAEREKLARHIHDSVLQSLAYVHKKGRELSTREPVPAAEVAELAQVAAKQEAELRSLILRDPEEAPVGRASLREALEEVSRSVSGVEVNVSSVGAIWLRAGVTEELAAAVRQSLENVVRHSQARGATVFAEVEDSQVTVTVRDDGVGFIYDEERLRSEGKAGMLKSMKGRAEDLGGWMTVTTSPGKGAEIEFRVPEEQPR
jgi:signal transduction histidine kinase